MNSYDYKLYDLSVSYMADVFLILEKNYIHHKLLEKWQFNET